MGGAIDMHRTIRRLTTACAGFAALLLASAAFADSPARLDDSKPQPLPPYTARALHFGEEGTVEMNIWVRPNGKPWRVLVTKSSGYYDLDTMAIQGALNGHYIAAVKDGETIGDWAFVKVVYKLPGSAPSAQPAKFTE